MDKNRLLVAGIGAITILILTMILLVVYKKHKSSEQNVVVQPVESMSKAEAYKSVFGK